MAGPTFSFWYADFDEAAEARLEAALRALTHFRRLDARPRGKKRRGSPFEAEFVLEASVVEGAKAGARTGLMGVHVSQRDAYVPEFAREAFVRALGFVPCVELAGYCMANGELDRLALQLVATRVAASLGGWVLLLSERHELPELPSQVSIIHEGVREIVARDVTAYFGSLVHDEAYVRENLNYVPEERWWAIDARLEPSWWVRK